MKSLSPILLCLLAFTLLLGQAQEARALDLKGVAVKAGGSVFFNDFQFDVEDRVDLDAQWGVVGGVSSIWRWSRRSPWMIVLETLYVAKGYQGTHTLETDGEGIDVDVRANYVSVPILGRVNFSEDDLTTYAIFGPTLEFLLDRDDDVLLDGFPGWSIGGGVGIGFELEVSDRAQAVLEFRFNTDFTDNWEGPDEIGLSSARYRGGIVMGGVRF